MDDAVLEQLRAAYARLAAGDPDSFAEVLDPDVHWRGVVSGVFRKRHAY
jgi:ketosteroid isomerase-like protein